MKKTLLLLTLLIITPVLMAQKTTPKDAWLEKWENSKSYLIALAETMPEEHYNFKPTERQMSFKEQLIHIKGNMDWLSTTYFSEEEFKRTKADIPATKLETINLLTASFDAALEKIKKSPDASLKDEVSFFAGDKTKLQILNLLQDHVTHHRGQLIVYLNLNNVEPPRYVGW